MNYPGNLDLAEDVQRRVLSTFESMLREVADGNYDDALMGCTFIERLDPSFGPVTELRSRINNATEDGVEVADLATLAGLGVLKASSDSTIIEPIETVETAVIGESDSTIELMSNTELLDVESAASAGTTASDSAEESVEESDVAPVVEKTAEETLVEGPANEEPTIAEPAPDEEPSDPQLDDQPDDRVAALLAEGQTAFDGGDFQTAIDAWSRVFLIDLDHATANEKIEEARRRLAERDRQAEELFHAGLEKIESGDTEGARADLVAALELQPNHIGAQEHLERLKAGKASPETDQLSSQDLRAEPTEAIPPPPPIPVPDAREATRASVASSDDSTGTTAEASRQASSKRKISLSPKFLVIAGLALALVTIGGWFIFNQRKDLFPNAGGDSSETVARHPIDRAQALYTHERLDSALAVLERIPATDARHGEAQALIEKWQAESDEVAAASAEEEGQPSTEEIAARDALIAQGRSALETGVFHRAVEALDQAAEIAPLAGDQAALLSAAQQRMEPYADAYLSYRDGDYSTAIAPLWRTLRESPNNPAVRDLLVASHFNMARRSLAGGSVESAVESFSEASKLAPRDQQILQALRFSEQYVGGGQDLRYRIFVKYLPQR